MRAGNRGAHRIHMVDRLINQRQNQIQIMDHQVQNNGNIRAPRLERGNANRFNVERLAHPGGHGAMGGGKPLQMADLQNLVGGARHAGQFSRLVERGGNRFFHQHVFARPQRPRRQLEMQLGRRGDDHRIRDFQQFRDAAYLAASFPGHRLGALGIRIGNARKAGAGCRRQLQGMEAAKMPGADQPDLQSVHLTLLGMGASPARGLHAANAAAIPLPLR